MLLKGSGKCLKDHCSLMCSPPLANSSTTKLFINQKPTRHPSKLISSSSLHANHSHNSELPSWTSKSHSYSCNDPDFQVNLDLYQCNELQPVKENILGQIKSIFSTDLKAWHVLSEIIQIINELNVPLFQLCKSSAKGASPPFKSNQFQRKFHTLISFLGNSVRLISNQFPGACSYTLAWWWYHWKKAVIVEDGFFWEEYGHRWAPS